MADSSLSSTNAPPWRPVAAGLGETYTTLRTDAVFSGPAMHGEVAYLYNFQSVTTDMIFFKSVHGKNFLTSYDGLDTKFITQGKLDMK